MNNRKLAIAGAVVALVAGVAIAGPIIYAKSQDDAPPPLTVPTSAPTPTASTDSGPLATDGMWSVAPGSQAGYRVDEVLNGQDVTVIGRTEKVEGEVKVVEDEVVGADVTIDTASITTDNARRDAYFRDEALDVRTYPDAMFTLDVPFPLPPIGSDPVKVSAEGQLTMTGAAKPVKVAVKVVRTATGVAISGSIPITFKDYGIKAPDLGFVKVEDKGAVEFLLNLQK